MKKSIYIIGIICLSITLLATLFKVGHLQGAGVLLTVGLGGLTFAFLPLAFAKLLKSTDDKLLKLVYAAAFISFSVNFIGMLFKILHWPGAGILMVVGIPLPFILFLPAYITYHNKRKLKTDINFSAIILFMIYVGVFTSLLAFDKNKFVYKAYAHSTYELSTSNKYLVSENENNSGSGLSLSVNQLVKQIELIKQNLVKQANPENIDIFQPDGTIDYYQMSGKEMKLSLNLLNNAGFDQFNEKFKKFDNLLKTKFANDNTERLIMEIDTYRLPDYDGDAPLIAKLPLIATLSVLSDWQNKLLLISYSQTT
ncbi:MAG: hypothetical protein B6I20_10805 [Bacteroidetes bacterium 4572_117]|nr:MAG: hypothetical protein B6I20_10805 [Bacteroidetes bacterium 4572_117]